MDYLLEIERLRAVVLNEIIRLTNPNRTPFAGDPSFINGQTIAYKKIIQEIENTLEELEKGD